MRIQTPFGAPGNSAHYDAKHALNDAGKPVKGSKIHVMGVAYKRDIDDMRESPALDAMLLLKC